ncbi:hypothetical protein [Methylocystis hirsuta]|nr:hypothetical protein [Methylocystis hirsuta]
MASCGAAEELLPPPASYTTWIDRLNEGLHDASAPLRRALAR